MTAVRFVLLIGAGCAALSARAHNFSFTHVEIAVNENDLSITLGLNQSDLLDRVLGMAHDRGRFADRQEFEDAAPRVLAYVLKHWRVSADGQPLTATATDWPPSHVELTRVDPTGLEVPAVIPMTLRYRLPPAARRISINPRLYSNETFSAKFDVRIARGRGAKPLTMVVEKGGHIEFDLIREKVGPEHGNEMRWVIPVILVVLIVGVIWWRSRQRAASTSVEPRR